MKLSAAFQIDIVTLSGIDSSTVSGERFSIPISVFYTIFVSYLFFIIRFFKDTNIRRFSYFCEGFSTVGNVIVCLHLQLMSCAECISEYGGLISKLRITTEMVVLHLQ